MNKSFAIAVITALAVNAAKLKTRDLESLIEVTPQGVPNNSASILAKENSVKQMSAPLVKQEAITV
jgi:hypothetical protein